MARTLHYTTTEEAGQWDQKKGVTIMVFLTAALGLAGLMGWAEWFSRHAGTVRI